MPIKMEAVPELPEIKSEIKAEDFISASSTASNQSPHQQSHTPNLVEQIQNPANCGWVGNNFSHIHCNSRMTSYMIHSEEQTFPKQNSSKMINYAILTLFFLTK